MEAKCRVTSLKAVIKAIIHIQELVHLLISQYTVVHIKCGGKLFAITFVNPD